MKLTTAKEKLEYLENIFSTEGCITIDITDHHEVSRKDIWTDLLLHALNHVYREGLAEKSINIFLKFFYGLIEDTACQGLPLEEAAKVFRDRIQENSFTNDIPRPFVKSSIDYVCSTFLQHYHLVSHVMCLPRDVEEHVQCEQVEITSFNTMKLEEASPHDKWLADTKLKEAEETYKAKEKEIEDLFTSSHTNLEEELTECLNNLDIVSNKSELKLAIEKIVEKYANLTELQIEASLMKSKEHVIHSLEKSKLIPVTSSSKSRLKRLSAVSPSLKNRSKSSAKSGSPQKK